MTGPGPRGVPPVARVSGRRAVAIAMGPEKSVNWAILGIDLRAKALSLAGYALAPTIAHALVPTLRVGMPSCTLRVPLMRPGVLAPGNLPSRIEDDAERRRRHSHAERGNERIDRSVSGSSWPTHLKAVRSFT